MHTIGPNSVPTPTSSPKPRVTPSELGQIAIACLGGCGLIGASFGHFQQRRVRILAAGIGACAIVYSVLRAAVILTRSYGHQQQWKAPEPRQKIEVDAREQQFIVDQQRALHEMSLVLLKSVFEENRLFGLDAQLQPLTTIQEHIEAELESASSEYRRLLEALKENVAEVAACLKQAFETASDTSKSGQGQSPHQSVLDSLDHLNSSFIELPVRDSVEELSELSDQQLKLRDHLVHQVRQAGHPEDIIGERLRPRGKLLQMGIARDQILAGVADRLDLKTPVTFSERDGRISYTSRVGLLLELISLFGVSSEADPLALLLGHLCAESSEAVTDWEMRNAMMRYFNQVVHSDPDWRNKYGRELQQIAAAIFEDVKLQDFAEHSLENLAQRAGFKLDHEQPLLDQLRGFQAALDQALKTPGYRYGSELQTDRMANDMGCGATLLRYNMPWSNGSLEVDGHRIRLLRTGTPTEDYIDSESGQRRTRLIGPYVAYLDYLKDQDENILHVNLQKAVDPNANKAGVLGVARHWAEWGVRAAAQKLTPYGSLVEPDHTRCFVETNASKANSYDMITLSMEQAISKSWLKQFKSNAALTDGLVALVAKKLTDSAEFTGVAGPAMRQAVKAVLERRFNNEFLATVEERQELVLFCYAEMTRQQLSSGKYHVLQAHCKDGQDRRAILMAALRLDQMAKEGKLNDPEARAAFLRDIFLPSYVNSARGIHHGRFKMIELLVQSTEKRAERLKNQNFDAATFRKAKVYRHTEDQYKLSAIELPENCRTAEDYLNFLHYASFDLPEELSEDSLLVTLQQLCCSQEHQGGHAFVSLELGPRSLESQASKQAVTITVNLGAGKAERYGMRLSREPWRLSPPVKL